MKRLLFVYFVILSLLRLSYAEPLCKNDIDCVRKWAVNNRDIRYLTYGDVIIINTSHLDTHAQCFISLF